MIIENPCFTLAKVEPVSVWFVQSTGGIVFSKVCKSRIHSEAVELFLLRHTEIVSILELLKRGISFRGVGRVPARTPSLAWFAMVVTVV